MDIATIKSVISLLTCWYKKMHIVLAWWICSVVAWFLTDFRAIIGLSDRYSLIAVSFCSILLITSCLNKLAEWKAEQKKVRDAEIAKEKAKREAREAEERTAQKAREAEAEAQRKADEAETESKRKAAEAEHAKNKAIFELYKLLPEDLIETTKPFLDGKVHTVLSTGNLTVLIRRGILEQIALKNATKPGPFGPTTQLMVVAKINPAVLGMINDELLGVK